MAKVYLFFLSGSKKGKIDAADAQVVRIGRQPHSEILLDSHLDLPASGDHAQIVCQDDGTFVLFDCNSSWGTYKNGERLTGPMGLTTGDVITLGLDDAGREGPRVKFYLEKDILRCPSCFGPVYKRHFRCPDCRKKVCLRCIDFQRKICRPCAQSVPATSADNAGYDIVSDDAIVGKAPARVVISGKDAKRVRRAQAKKRAKKQAQKVPRPKPTAAVKRTKQMPGARGIASDPGIVAERVNTGAPFCTVCCDFVTASTFTCPSCEQPCCVGHRQGAVCPSCVQKAPQDVKNSSFRAGRGTEPELVVPDLDEIMTADQMSESTQGRLAAQRRAAAQRQAAAQHQAAAERQADAQRQATQRQATQRQATQRLAAQRQATQRLAAAQQRSVPAAPAKAPQDGSPEQAGSFLPPVSKIKARAPTVVPCERTGCVAALDLRTFFSCDGCRQRLCPGHAATKTHCDRCNASAPPPSFAPPPSRPAPIPATMHFDPRAILGDDRAPPRDPSSGEGPPLMARPPGFDSSTSSSGFGYRSGSGSGVAPLHVPRDPFASGSGTDPAVRGRGLGPPPADPKADQDLYETVDDDAPPPWGTQDMLETDDALDREAKHESLGLGAVSFECPYCEQTVAAHTRHCPRCKKDL